MSKSPQAKSQAAENGRPSRHHRRPYSKAGLEKRNLTLNYLKKKNASSPNTWAKASLLSLRHAEEGNNTLSLPSLATPLPPQKRKRTMKLKPEKMPRGSGRQFTAGKTEPLARCGPWTGGGGLNSVPKCLEGIPSQVTSSQAWF